MKKNEKFENFCHMVFNRPRRLKSSGLTTSASAVKAGKLICRPGRFLLAYLLAAIVLVLFSASGAWAENYTSFNSTYPDYFWNTKFDTEHNDMVEMDAVNFKGYEFIFFTLHSTVSDCTGSNASYLYWYIPGTDYCGKVDIHNSHHLHFRIKTCVFKDILYIFYTTSSGDTDHPNTNIYYRTCNIESDTTGIFTFPDFSDEKSYAAGVSPATILFAAEMNEKLYVMFSSNKDWYVTSSSVHGATFAPKANIYTAIEGLYGPGGTVFPVLDAEGEMVDRMMVAYCTENEGYIKTWFFDGERAYGGHNVSTPGIYARSVRLFAGGADGYNNSSFSIQIFISAPEDGSEKWAALYHTEYIPSGINGDAGSWSSSWTYLQNSNDDNPHCYNPYGSDDSWSVIPVYTEEDNHLRTSLRIWYGKGTNFCFWPDWGANRYSDEIKFRASTYKSDLLEHVGDTQITQPYELDDLSLAFVVGILEGTPPFPVNNRDLGTVNTNTSALTLGTSTNTDVSTAWTAGTSVGISTGQTVKDKGGWEFKFTSGLKYTYSDTTSCSASVQYTFKTYTNEPPGNYGWAMVFRPVLLINMSSSPMTGSTH
jgi:hypothetical protein